MKKLFNDFDNVYTIFEEVCSRVKIYKSELGSTLESNIKTMKKLFDKFMVIGLDIIKYHKMTNDKIFKQSLKSVEEAQELRGFLENKIKENHSLYEAQRAEAHYYKELLEQKEVEIDYLYSVQKNFQLKNDYAKEDNKEIDKSKDKSKEDEENKSQNNNDSEEEEQEETKYEGNIKLPGSKEIFYIVNRMKTKGARRKPLNNDEIKSVHKNLTDITSNYSNIIKNME